MKSSDIELRFVANIFPTHTKTVRVTATSAYVYEKKIAKQISLGEIRLFQAMRVVIIPVERLLIHQIWAGEHPQLFSGAMPIEAALLNVIGGRMAVGEALPANVWAFEVENESVVPIELNVTLRGRGKYYASSIF